MRAPPILITGPTASGKSALALALAQATGGVVVNADALQVYDAFRILTARPSPAEEAAVPHRLYGSIGFAGDWSVGHWLRAVAELMGQETRRLIITGGTGLYLRALVEGLAEVPATPPGVRAEGDRMRLSGGAAAFRAVLAARDPATLSRIDSLNPMRLQRAWEVLAATGRGLAAWQAATPPPLVGEALCLHVAPGVGAVNARIATRLRAMLAEGVLDEVAALLASGLWDPARPAAKALGAAAFVAHLRGEISLDAALEGATTATRQFAKRQRTWFRARMPHWHRLDPDRLPDPGSILALPVTLAAPTGPDHDRSPPDQP